VPAKAIDIENRKRKDKTQIFFMAIPPYRLILYVSSPPIMGLLFFSFLGATHHYQGFYTGVRRG
jgi:hypothetical protein